MTCALVASRIVSMTFIPQLGYYLMRPGKPLPPIEYRRTHGVTGFYYKIGHYALEHRKTLIACSLLFLAGGFLIGKQLRSAFFPEDVQYLSYVDVWLPNGAALSETNNVAKEAEAVVRRVAAQYGAATSGPRRQAARDPQISDQLRRRRRSALLVHRRDRSSAE